MIFSWLAEPNFDRRPRMLLTFGSRCRRVIVTCNWCTLDKVLDDTSEAWHDIEETTSLSIARKALYFPTQI